MKRLSFISIITAAVAFGFASCAEEAEEFKKGAPDSADCYGVYFPAQKTDLSLDPSEPTLDTIFVARTKTEGAITVPYVLKDENDIFEASELTFEDGQTESYIVVTFDSAKVGVTYTCSFLIEDPAYASQYTSNAIAIDLKVMRDKWNELGMATFNDWFMLGDTYEALLLQNDNDKTKFRLMHPYDAGAAAGEYGANIGDPCEYIAFKLLKAGESVYDATITKSDLVYFDIASTGYFHPTYGGDILIVHPANFSSLCKEDNFLWNKVLQYQDNKLPAGVQLAPYYYIDGVGGWGNYNTDASADAETGIQIVYPGAVLTDYSLVIESDFAYQGEQDVAFILGTDIAYVDFATYDGALNSAQIDAKLEAILGGEEPNIETIDSTSVVTLSFAATGEYTILAVAYDAEDVPQTFETTVLNYVAKDDEVPVDIDAELISTKKYEKLELSSDNILEFSIYGSELKSVLVGLFSSSEFLSDPMGIVDMMLEDEENSYAVDEETLAEINDMGYTDVFTDLNPGLAYTLLVIATNGYEQDFVMCEASTTGDPLPPLYMKYYSYDIFTYDQFPTSITDFEGEYDFLAIRKSGKTGEREKISTFTLKAVTDSTVAAVGLFGADAKIISVKDSVLFEYYGGVLYTLANTMPGPKYNAAIRWDCPEGTMGWNNPYLMVGGFIDDDDIAFIDAGTGYGFDGWALTAYTDSLYKSSAGNLDVYYEPLFATKGIYDKLLTPAKSQAQARLGELSAALNARRTNYVETEIGYIRSTIKNFMDAPKKVTPRGRIAGLDIVPEARSVEAKIVGVKAYEPSKRSIELSDERVRF